MRLFVHRAGLDKGKDNTYLCYYDSAESIPDTLTRDYSGAQDIMELLFAVDIPIYNGGNTDGDSDNTVDDFQVKLSY